MLFRWTLLEEVQEIALEIGMLGKYELDINNSTETVIRGRCRRGLSLRENQSAFIYLFIILFPVEIGIRRLK